MEKQTNDNPFITLVIIFQRFRNYSVNQIGESA